MGDETQTDGSDRDLCGDHDGRRYYCTEPKGHDGSHVARDAPNGKVLNRWSQGRNSRSLDANPDQ